MGKGKDTSKSNAVEHVSRPLSTLKDPASFGPPPKNVNYHGGAALPDEITPHTGGWGAPLTPDQIHGANRAVNGPTDEGLEEEKKTAGPPLPYRADRTGLKTDHLPPPPTHRDVNRAPVAEIQPPKPKPGLPPRLPARQNAASVTPPPVVTSPPPQVAPPTYESIPKQPSPKPSSNFGINQAAVNRLGNAGISVPALGIGSSTASTNPWRNEQSQSTTKNPSPKPQPAINQLSELQSRFARMNASGSPQNVNPSYVNPTQPPLVVTNSATTPETQTQPQAQGTTWAEKQAALRTAQNLHKDPSTVTLADARSAATTVGSFRDRHQDSINAAGNKANEWNKKYNVTGRLNSFLEKHSSPTPETTPPAPTNQGVGMQPPPSQSPEIAASISRKPPPPPPPKKPVNVHGGVNSLAGVAAPPPVPLGTKPSYS